MYHVYTLSDPRTNEVRYIGISNNPHKRLGEHIRCDNIDNPIKDAWIIDLKTHGLIPLLTIIDQADSRSQAAKQETNWIRIYQRQNAPLLNHPKYLRQEVVA